jgi:antitoxin component HigA of HigAB toxin-antitoxin module
VRKIFILISVMPTQSLNPILVEYCQRFAKKDMIKPNFEKFFTSLEVETHCDFLPYLMDIQNFCLRMLKAYLFEEKVCIYSDYDTDAVTATATMYHGLLDIGFNKENIEFYAPDRFIEGYGMNIEAIQNLSQKFNLIISVDCGINSTEEAKKVKITNCDLIITDHHHLQEEVPDCVSVVNCRMANVYSSNQELKKTFEERKAFHEKQIISEVTKKLTQDQLVLLKKWLQKTNKDPMEFLSKPEIFLTQSATGVGVAWFSLVWFAYFLEYIKVQ